MTFVMNNIEMTNSAVTLKYNTLVTVVLGGDENEQQSKHFEFFIDNSSSDERNKTI